MSQPIALRHIMASFVADRYTKKLDWMPYECRQLMATGIWQSKKYIHQLGPMHYIYPFFDLSVANHMLQSYSIFRYWLEGLQRGEEGDLTPEDIRLLSIAILSHDIRKPPWTPISEPYQTLQHEVITNCGPIIDFCKKHGVNLELLNETIQGKGLFGNFLEAEINFDQMGYFIPELKRAGIPSNTWLGVSITVNDVLELLRSIVYKKEKGRYQTCIKYGDIENRKVQKLLLTYKEAIVNYWKSFLDPKIHIMETVVDHLLRNIFQSPESKRIDDPLCTDFDFENALINSPIERLKVIVRQIREGSIVNKFQVIFREVTPSFQNKLLGLKGDFNRYRKLMSLVEEEVRGYIGQTAYVAASATMRHKPYFIFTLKPKDWPISVKYETASGGFEDVSARLESISKLRQQEKYAYLHIIYPPKHEFVQQLKPLLTGDEEERKKAWEALLQSAMAKF